MVKDCRATALARAAIFAYFVASDARRTRPGHAERRAQRSSSLARGSIGESTEASAGQPRLRIALYSGEGTSQSLHSAYRVMTEALMSEGLNFTVTNMTGGQVAGLTTRNHDLVFFPGGSGSKQAEGIGESGIAAVKEFVTNGGGYIGICGGAFLAIDSLKFFGDDVRTKSPWDRGDGEVVIQFTHAGVSWLRLVGDDEYHGPVNIRYFQGPIVAPEDFHSDVEVLASYTTEINSNHPEETSGQMVNTPAISARLWSKGRVLISGVHPELMPWHPDLLHGYIAWASQLPVGGVSAEARKGAKRRLREALQDDHHAIRESQHRPHRHHSRP